MWSILNGTIVNVITVLAGSAIGLSAGRNLGERYRSIVLQCLGLITITMGIDASVLDFSKLAQAYGPRVRESQTYGARLAMVVVGSLLVGAMIGTWLRIHERIEGLGGWIHSRFSQSGDGGKMFAEGFLTASVIFCVGPLTLLGCLENGTHGNPRLLYIKAFLDGFCSMALASSLGSGVLASVLTVGILQGGLAILAYEVGNPMDDVSIGLMTAVGGIALLGTAMILLDIKRIPVANMLPGLFIPPLIIWLSRGLMPGLLLPS
ncbi:MAG: DUF554 domain-containing protein [Planctomycetes bacterium]|nr:DUF554 domain-containing protein [Planctomycetota bacterium]MBI3834683.1 DUF554 domain-containing protein [Planctomycetota bacterium]